MASISLERITKRIGDRIILDDISLEIRDREFFAVIGPSGCGKTFLLRTIAGLERPDSGTVRFDGEDVTALAPHKRNVAMVFQTYALYPHLRVRGNIGFPLYLLHMQEDEIERRVVRTAEELGSGLVSLLDRRPRELAVGHQQRVAIGRAVIRQPRVYLFDEPLSNLETKMALISRYHLKRLFRDLGTTVVYVTPDDKEAFALADRVAVMSPGRIEQVSTPQGVWARPINRFVAEFIHRGALNCYPARLEGEWVQTPFFTVPVVPSLLARARGLRELVIGLRPDHLHLSSPENAPLIAQVELVETLLPERQKRVHLRQGAFSGVATVPLEWPVRRGEWVGVTVDLENAFLFDPRTGRTLY